MISTNALYLAHKGGEIWTLLTMDIGIEIKHGHSPHVHFSLSLDCLMWWMRVCLSLYNLMICPYLGCVTEAGKWRIGWGAHSGVGMRGQWRLSLQSWSWSSVSARARLSVTASGEIFTESWRKPRAPSRQRRGGDKQSRPHGPLHRAQDKKVIVLSSELPLPGSAGSHGWCRAYKTPKNPGQVFTCEAAKPRRGPGSTRSPWPDRGPTYNNDFPWIAAKCFYLVFLLQIHHRNEHKRSLFLEAAWHLI